MTGNNIDIASRILYEDNHLLGMNKLPAEIVQGDKTGDTPLSDTLKLYIKVKYSKPGAVFLGVIHRLDRPTSGVLVFARTSKALSRMNELIREREARKIYWAVVKERPPQVEGTLVHYLKRNEEKNKSFVVTESEPGAVRAELHYRILASAERYHLLEVDLKTGRHHQIRAQLASIGCPVKGDLKYGFPRSNPDASIHLHARSISFLHPVKNEPLQITGDPPCETLWNHFLTLITSSDEKKTTNKTTD